MSRTLFVTGKLAAQSLVDTLEKMNLDFEWEIDVQPITVAALMDTRFVAKHLSSAKGCEVVMLPGLCHGDLAVVAGRVGVETVRGPKNLKDLPAYFGKAGPLQGYGQYHVKILAEIVDAYQLRLEDILARAEYFRASGADIIDLGCPVHASFPNVQAVVQALKQQGYQVSLDTFNPDDILKADQAGIDYLLSVNSQNIHLAPQLACKVVVIPDFDQGLASLERNVAQLEAWGVPYIIDPILNPISFGFTESLHRYTETRRRYPQAEMLMGVGNLTELIDADTTGINAMMAGVLSELDIDYVLTTEVISWARGAVRELNIGRQLMHYACQHHILPKHLDDRLLTLKDPPYDPFSEQELRAIQAQVRDPNFRIFTDRDAIYVFNNRLFLKDTNPQRLFSQLGVSDASHAFYLGRELQKAAIAVQLGKQYQQEGELRWGYLTQEGDAADAQTERP